MNDTHGEKIILDELKHFETIPIFNELSFAFTLEEVTNAINKLKSGKSPGIDCISGEIIKASGKIIAPILVKLFNNILISGTYPSTWTMGLLTPIHKKGSFLLPDNYRGITVTNCLSKVFGILLSSRLESFCTKHSLINEKQSSHKKGVRTSDNVFVMKALFEKYCGKKEGKLFACFVDFRKAFDSIWQEALFLKLLKYDIGGPFYRIIKKHV